MAKYLIHSYPKRMWYVENFLIPSMLEQGIARDDIFLFNDDKGLGNLEAFLESLKPFMDEEGGLWHIQDDVLIASYFREVTEKFNEGLVCGFCYEGYEKGVEAKGRQPVYRMWMSFPCIRIPNKYLREFYNWVKNYAADSEAYSSMVKTGKSDDYLFKRYLMERHGLDKVYNLKPNIVEHVDYLLGGSIANSQRGSHKVTAWFFEEPVKVKELEKEIERFKEQN